MEVHFFCIKPSISDIVDWIFMNMNIITLSIFSIFTVSHCQISFIKTRSNALFKWFSSVYQWMKWHIIWFQSTFVCIVKYRGMYIWYVYVYVYIYIYIYTYSTIGVFSINRWVTNVARGLYLVSPKCQHSVELLTVDLFFPFLFIACPVISRGCNELLMWRIQQ